MLPNPPPLSVQRVFSSGTSTTRFLGTSATTTRVGWRSSSLVITTSTPGWPSPRATLSPPWSARGSWGRMTKERRRMWCRPTATWTAGLRWSPACARPRRARRSPWRRETSSVSGCKTFHWWTTRTEPQPLGCTSCRTSMWAHAWISSEQWELIKWMYLDLNLLTMLFNRLDQQSTLGFWSFFFVETKTTFLKHNLLNQILLCDFVIFVAAVNGCSVFINVNGLVWLWNETLILNLKDFFSFLCLAIRI